MFASSLTRSMHGSCGSEAPEGRLNRFVLSDESDSSAKDFQMERMNTFSEPDPAEREAFNRFFYRNRRPTWLGHWVSQFFCWWARCGMPPRSWVSLEVRDRVSGRMRADAVVIPTVAGERFVVSMFGTISDWVHNLDAAHGDAVISHGHSQRVRLILLPPGERPHILREY